MVVAFAILLFRRWYKESKKGAEREILASITRSYMRRVAGQADEGANRNWSNDHKLQAVSHIHMLLRGGERKRLMQMAELDGLLRACLSKSNSISSARRIDAIRLLQQFGSEACVARLREIFARDRNDTVRLEAAFALAAVHSLPPPRETIRILGMFERKTNRLDSALLRASAPEYTQQLILLLDDSLPPEKRALIIDSLGWSEDPAILPILEKASRDDDPESRSASLRAAARLGNPSAAEWIIELLSDPVAFVRIQAVNCCASLGLSSTVPALHEMLEDEDIWVRLRAERALDVLEYDWPVDQSKGLVA